MKNKIKQIMICLALIMGFGVLAFPAPVGAAGNVVCPPGAPVSRICGDSNSLGDIIKVGISTLMYVIGIVAVLMIIISAARLVMSGGDAAVVKNAKNSILYSLVGVVVAILGYAVVNFVIGSF